MTLLVRRPQMEALARVQRERFVGEMCAHLHRHFGDQLAGIDDGALRARVSRALDDAAGFGLTSRRDGCRCLNLAATLGWDYLDRPEHAWIRAALADERLARPSDRLARVIDECAFRLEADENDRRLREALGVAPPAVDTAAEPQHETEAGDDDGGGDDAPPLSVAKSAPARPRAGDDAPGAP